MKILANLAFILSLQCALPGSAQAMKEIEDVSFKTEAHAILQQDLSTKERGIAYRKLYDKYYPPARRDALKRGAEPDQARAWFDATLSVFFHTLDRNDLPDFMRAMEKLEANREARAADYSYYYKSLLAAREFGMARIFSQSHAQIGAAPVPETVPLTASTHGMTEWIVEDDGRTLRQIAYGLPPGSAIVAVSNPGCHFSQRAFAAIASDPDLKAEILPILKLVAPPDTNFNIEQIDAWNKANPALTTTLMHDIREWPMLSDWSTPTFYFFHDGKLVSYVSGWPKSGNKAALRSALRQALAKPVTGTN